MKIIDSNNVGHLVESREVPAHGKYRVRIGRVAHSLTISVLHVDRKWMPFTLFGRTILTRVVPLLEGDGTDILLTPDEGLVRDVLHHVSGAETVHALPEAMVKNPRNACASRVRKTILGLEWPSTVRADAYAQIARVLRPSAARIAIQFNGLGAVIAASLVAVVIVGAMSGNTAPRQDLPSAAPAPAVEKPLSASEKRALSSEAFANDALQKGVISLPEAVAQANKIVLRPTPAGGKGIILWADPLCSNCRDFESTILPQVPQDVGVTVIPVAFKEGSRPLVSYVACGKDDADRAARWTGLMAPQPHGQIDQQCAAGPEVADRNTALFVRAGLVATPTIMRIDQGNARLFDGDRNSVAGIKDWMKS